MHKMDPWIRKSILLIELKLHLGSRLLNLEMKLLASYVLCCVRLIIFMVLILYYLQWDYRLNQWLTKLWRRIVLFKLLFMFWVHTTLGNQQSIDRHRDVSIQVPKTTSESPICFQTHEQEDHDSGQPQA
jgi:hypothetical protein